MKKLALPENFDHKNIDILKQFISETGKIIPAGIIFPVSEINCLRISIFLWSKFSGNASFFMLAPHF